MSVIVGIDPGLSGAIAWIGSDQGATIMPTINGEIDLSELGSVLLRLKPRLVCLEVPEAPANQSAPATLKTGINWGLIVGMIRDRGIPYHAVRSSSWKSKLGISKQGDKPTRKQKKQAAIAQALKLFPSVDLKATERCKTYHDGMAEALLIAEYARRHLNL